MDLGNRKKPGAPSAGKASGAAGANGKKKKGRGGRIAKGILRFIAVCMCLGIIGVSVLSVALSLYVVKATANDAEVLDLDELALAYTSIVYYKEVDPVTGQVSWPEYQQLDSPTENRIWVDLGQISDNLEHAFVAIEDQDFYTHSGFNFKRTVYAALNEVAHALTGSYLRGNKQGASTINQQLIKNLTGEDDSSGIEGYLRKIREIFRAIGLNSRYSKDEILEAYLNTIDLTGSIGGVEMGANEYFNKHAGDAENQAEGKSPLTLAQCASIAAITNNPTEYNPYQSPEKHLERRNLVLRNMYEQGYIVDANGNPDEAAYEAALAEPLVLYEQERDENAATTSTNDWFVDAMIKEVVNDLLAENPYGRENYTYEDAQNDFYTQGLRIYSTVQPDLQDQMEAIFLEGEHWPAYETERIDEATGEVIIDEATGEPEMERTQAAAVSVNYDGELCAVVGAIGQKTGDMLLNQAIDSTRQVGSTMKGVAAYPLAIEYGYANYSKTFPDSYFQDITEPDGTKRQWPVNYSGTPTDNQVTVYEAVKQSLNTVAVWVGDLVEAQNMYDFATETLNVSSLVYPQDCDLAPMVLGAMTQGMSPYELAGCYMMYGNGGRFTNLHSYTTVEDFRGNVILEKDVYTVQAISEDTAYIMNRLLYAVMHDARGTANKYAASIRGMESIGKTGTSNNNKDIWFVGLTPYYCTAFWWGYASGNENLINTYNPAWQSHPGASAWKELMENTLNADEEKYPAITWEMPDTVVQRSFCTVTGLLASGSCSSTRTGYYKTTDNISTCPGGH